VPTPITFLDVLKLATSFVNRADSSPAPPFPVPITLSDLLISVSATDVEIADKFYPAGLQLRGKAAIFGQPVAEVSAAVGWAGIKGFFKIAPIRVGNVFAICASAAEPDKGPFVDVDVSFYPPRGGLRAGGYAKVLGGYAQAQLAIRFDSFSLTATVDRILSVPYTAALEYSGRWSSTGVGLTIRGLVENKGIEEQIVQYITGALDNQKREADEKSAAPLRRLRGRVAPSKRRARSSTPHSPNWTRRRAGSRAHARRCKAPWLKLTAFAL
jgi:hypothetical protein